jgi:putative addiction module CopG family antidote
MASNVESSVPLSPEMAQLVRSLVDSGRFSSAAEAVHGALLLLRDEALDDVDDLAELQEDVRVGLAQLDAGQGEPWDPEAVKARLRDRLAAERSGG